MRMLELLAMRLLGGLSYILYCFHWPLMEMLQFFNVLPDSLPVSN